jgi:hypothetical protein
MLVASAVHIWSAEIIWQITVRTHLQVIVSCDPYERSELEHWWCSTQDVEDVEQGVLALINASLGFAIRLGRG